MEEVCNCIAELSISLKPNFKKLNKLNKLNKLEKLKADEEDINGKKELLKQMRKLLDFTKKAINIDKEAIEIEKKYIKTFVINNFSEREVYIQKLDLQNLIDDSKKTSTLKYNKHPYIKKVEAADCQSYIVSRENNVKNEDQFMEYLFSRKMLALTELKRKDYVNIRFPNFKGIDDKDDISIYKPKDPGKTSQDSGSIWDFEKKYTVTITPYFHIFPKSEKKQNLANEHAITFHCCSKEKSINYEFASDISNLKIMNPGTYITLTDLLKITKFTSNMDFIDEFHKNYDDWTHVGTLETSCGIKEERFVPLFLLFLVYTYVELSHKENKKDCMKMSKEEYLKMRDYVQKYWEKWENVTFVSLTMSYNNLDYVQVINTLKKIIEKKEIYTFDSFYGFLNRWIFLPEDEQISRMNFYNKFSNFVKFDAEGALYYKNKRMWIRYLKDDSKKEYLFDAAWGALLGTMLVRISDRLIGFNIEIDERNKDKIAHLRDLSRQAFQEFRDYYDVAVLSGNARFRSALETAKETFEINFYYDSLKKKLELFSNYEVADEQRKLSKQISYGGLFALLVLLDTLIYSISEKLNINSNIELDLRRIFLSPFISILLVSATIFILYSMSKSFYNKHSKQ